MGPTFTIGELSGVEQVTLTTQQMPAHTHPLSCVSGGGTTSNPKSALWANSDLKQYSTVGPTVQMAANSSDIAGGSQPHGNFMPYLCVNFIISLFGIYPQQ
jgi:microcystin-dependent protein